MNLVIDSGNTLVKYALFDLGRLKVKGRWENLSSELVETLLLSAGTVNRCIVSTVGASAEGTIAYLKKAGIQSIELNHETPLPFTNSYGTPETLGYDRIAAAAGAYTIFPDSNVLIVDAGTAITIDFLSADGVFMGGNISPGAAMRAKAMHAFTKKLPEIRPERTEGLLGKSTKEALLNGVMNGICFEIEGYIERLLGRYDDLNVILTGGDSPLFDKKLKYPIFVDSDLNLKGLNRILEHNA
jgi:type III pantothenate kinase